VPENFKNLENIEKKIKNPSLQSSFQKIQHSIDLRENTSHLIPLLSSLPINKDHKGVIKGYCSCGGKHTDNGNNASNKDITTEPMFHLNLCCAFVGSALK
jgi:hypothetical protein